MSTNAQRLSELAEHDKEIIPGTETSSHRVVTSAVDILNALGEPSILSTPSEPTRKTRTPSPSTIRQRELARIERQQREEANAEVFQRGYARGWREGVFATKSLVLQALKEK